jgi:hypothetical protein
MAIRIRISARVSRKDRRRAEIIRARHAPKKLTSESLMVEILTFTGIFLTRGGLMVYQAHIAGGMALLALVAGTWLTVRVCHEEICCRWFAKAVGIFVITLSLLMLACNAYHSFLYWKMGADKMPGMGMGAWTGMHGPRMMGGMGMQQMPQPPRPPMNAPPMPPQPGMGPGMMPGQMSMERPAPGAAQAQAQAKGCPMMKMMQEQGKAGKAEKSAKPEKPQAK